MKIITICIVSLFINLSVTAATLLEQVADGVNTKYLCRPDGPLHADQGAACNDRMTAAFAVLACSREFAYPDNFKFATSACSANAQKALGVTMTGGLLTPEILQQVRSALAADVTKMGKNAIDQLCGEKAVERISEVRPVCKLLSR